MSDEDYARGWLDGKADRSPDIDRMALGANRMNDYEIGYIDSGFGDMPQRWPDGWAIPNPGAAPSGEQRKEGQR